jgi:hypothetical protein
MSCSTRLLWTNERPQYIVFPTFWVGSKVQNPFRDIVYIIRSNLKQLLRSSSTSFYSHPPLCYSSTW